MINDRKPYLKFSSKPLNNTTSYNDKDFDPTELPLHTVCLIDESMKIMFTVRWQDGTNQRAFEIVNFGCLYLDGVHKQNTKPASQSSHISANAQITQMMFDKMLRPYGIILDKVSMHNYNDFDSTEFHFETPEQETQFRDYIDQALQNKLKK